MYSLRDQGYPNFYGYDIYERLEIRQPDGRSHYFIADRAAGGRLPFDDNSFDLIISEQVFEHLIDQVGLLRELYPIMRPVGHALHGFPARYCLIEPHMYVPIGGPMGHLWW